MNVKKQRLTDYHTAFSTPAGKRVLEDLDRAFGRRVSFVAGDPYATAFREGQRAVFELIRNLIAAATNPDVMKQLDEEIPNG